MTRTIVDTGPLVAYCSERDQHHEWVVAQLKALRPPLHTCEAVIAETDYLTRSRGHRPDFVYDWIREGVITVSFSLSQEVSNVSSLLTRYSASGMQLADACLVRMSEVAKDCQVLTLDADFTIYRRFGRQVIPVLLPLTG